MKSLSLDAKKETFKGKFKPSNAAEREFAKQLKKVARASGGIVDTHVDGVQIIKPEEMHQALKKYSEALTPWARRQSAKMLEKVQRSNKSAYTKKSKALGKLLNENLFEESTGLVAIDMLTEQVELIKSIPLEAGLRAQRIAFEAAMHGTRAAPDQDTIDELQKQMGMTTEVAINRARLIARTETARANASINQARAMNVGSRQYRWHNSGDGSVRESHRIYRGKRLQGKIFSWDDPPTLDDGMTGHPGTFENCRCFAEPVFDEE